MFFINPFRLLFFFCFIFSVVFLVFLISFVLYFYLAVLLFINIFFSFHYSLKSFFLFFNFFSFCRHHTHFPFLSFPLSSFFIFFRLLIFYRFSPCSSVVFLSFFFRLISLHFHVFSRTYLNFYTKTSCCDFPWNQVTTSLLSASCYNSGLQFGGIKLFSTLLK